MTFIVQVVFPDPAHLGRINVPARTEERPRKAPFWSSLKRESACFHLSFRLKCLISAESYACGNRSWRKRLTRLWTVN